jgi:sulfate adenylyltransferase subunit 2
MLSSLDELEAQTIYILREAHARVEPLGMLWSIGKDSNALLWMARKAFFGGVPFPVIQLDTAMELPGVYEFRDRIVSEWGLDLHVEECLPVESNPQTPRFHPHRRRGTQD